jgi:hypothetical protein
LQVSAEQSANGLMRVSLYVINSFLMLLSKFPSFCLLTACFYVNLLELNLLVHF